MTNKLKLLIWGALIAVGLLVTSLFLSSKNKKKVVPIEVVIPTKVVVPTRAAESSFSNTGAKYISPTDQEYTLDWLIGNFRDKTPFSTAIFSISYDYKNDKFVVILVDKTDTGKQAFSQWMKEAGYEQIPTTYFVFQ